MWVIKYFDISFQMTVLMTSCFMIAWTPYAILSFYHILGDFRNVPPFAYAGKIYLGKIHIHYKHPAFSDLYGQSSLYNKPYFCFKCMCNQWFFPSLQYCICTLFPKRNTTSFFLLGESVHHLYYTNVDDIGDVLQPVKIKHMASHG